MKKIIYTVALLVASLGAAKAQKPIKEAKEEIGSLILLQNDLLVYTRKEADGQFIYTEKSGQLNSLQRDPVLNAGRVNSVIGANPAANEVFVYQKLGRKKERIAICRWDGAGFAQVEERRLPKMKNNSPNLGLFLTTDKRDIFISGELRNSRGYDDIYVSRWQGGSWSKPANLGGTVNTRQPEFAMSVGNDSLYFSRKEGNQAYVYAVPLGSGDGWPQGEPVKAKANVNQGDAFNAYYSRSGDRETWVTSAVGYSEHTAYLGEAARPAAEPVAANVLAVRKPAPARAAEPVGAALAKPAAPAPARPAATPVAAEAAAADLKLFYGYNKVYLEKQEMEALAKFLARQKAGSVITIKGYSDSGGTDKGKQQVSQQRAANVKWFIESHSAGKQFQVETENFVSNAKGKEERKVVLFVKK